MRCDFFSLQPLAVDSRGSLVGGAPCTGSPIPCSVTHARARRARAPRWRTRVACHVNPSSYEFLLWSFVALLIVFGGVTAIAWCDLVVCPRAVRHFLDGR